jgi:hypothetical protein
MFFGVNASLLTFPKTDCSDFPGWQIDVLPCAYSTGGDVAVPCLFYLQSLAKSICSQFRPLSGQAIPELSRPLWCYVFSAEEHF